MKIARKSAKIVLKIGIAGLVSLLADFQLAGEK